jgi:hypothetical protein
MTNGKHHEEEYRVYCEGGRQNENRYGPLFFCTEAQECLNQSAANIWYLCDGKRTVADIARVLEKELKSPVAEQTLWVALIEFGNAGLLRNDIPRLHTARRLPVVTL